MRWLGAEVIAPHRPAAAAAQFLESDANRSVELAGARDKLGVAENNLVESLEQGGERHHRTIRAPATRYRWPF
jgi:hypothetical protein